MDENTTISDKIDGIIFPLPFEDKIKCWELIEELITERIEENKVKKFSISDVISSVCVSCDEEKQTHEICMECISKMIRENKTQTDL